MKNEKIKTHPDYDEYSDYWKDCYVLIEKGDSRTVKNIDNQEDYLPKLESQLRKGVVQGEKEYQDFLFRAIWSDIPKDTVAKVLGRMFAKPSTYKLPSVFDDYIEEMTNSGNGLAYLEEQISKRQLTYTRVGLMLYTSNDLTASKLPKVAMYDPLNILNWNFTYRDGEIVYDFILLKSTEYEMNPDNFEYQEIIYYIIHALSPEKNYYKVKLTEDEYETYGLSYEARVNHETYIEPLYKGFNLDFVPFVVINGNNIDEEINTPVLYEQAQLAVAAYNAAALYKMKCKKQTWAILAGAGYKVPEPDSGIKADGTMFSENPNAKLGYTSPAVDGLEALKADWEDAKRQAEQKGIVIAEKTQVESGTALEKRSENQVNSYKTLAEMRAKGILKLLWIVNKWGSHSQMPEIDWIVPFTEFQTTNVSTEDTLRVSELVDRGHLPLEDEYRYQKKHGYTNYKNFTMWKADLNTSNTSE